MSNSRLKSRILHRTRELGFDLAGVAPADPPPTAGRYREWLERGFAGEMGYLHRHAEKKADLSLVLLDVQSVLVVGMNYFTEPAHLKKAPSPRRGIISRYAWGHDYHDLMKQRLEGLLRFIREIGPEGADGRWYVDTGPVLERDLASRSGIGWVGKHTNILNRKMGNFFFLGEILLNFPLPPDEPASEHCGKCTRCIDICPTRAILEPYVLDARRCISYLTIELKGPIPRELRPHIGNRIYGCDDCLDVCPWNRFARASRESAFRPRLEPAAPLLRDLMGMDEKTFRQTFRGSPILRTKRHGFLRNVAVALGNSGDRLGVPVLLAALDDEHPLVRGHAAWALGRLGDTEGEGVADGLRAARETEPDGWAKEEMDLALDGLGVS